MSTGDPEHREPTLKIVCPYDFSRKQHGLFADGCPNLVWELMRTRREQLSASQLMRKNPTEAIVDKDNHLRDTLKTRASWKSMEQRGLRRAFEKAVRRKLLAFAPDAAGLSELHVRGGGTLIVPEQTQAH